MKKIFLCSSFADVAQLLPKLVAQLQGKTVAFIPTASIHEEYTQYVEDGKAALESLGLVVKEMEVTLCDTRLIAQVIKDCDCIYVSGGNSFFLLQELRRTGADKLIAEHVERGKLFIGESAGAMIAAPNVEYAKEMDDHRLLTPDFDNFTGLDIVDFCPVPHFNTSPFEEATQQIMQKYNHLPLKPINNLQAIVVSGDNMTVRSKE